MRVLLRHYLEGPCIAVRRGRQWDGRSAVDPTYLQQPPKIKLKIIVQSFINIQLKKIVMRERRESGSGQRSTFKPRRLWTMNTTHWR